MNNNIVTNDSCKIGDKVVRGRDWQWGNQDKDSVYGIIKSKYHQWVDVMWVNYKGLVTYTNSYRTGPSYYDLYFYE